MNAKKLVWIWALTSFQKATAFAGFKSAANVLFFPVLPTVYVLHCYFHMHFEACFYLCCTNPRICALKNVHSQWALHIRELTLCGFEHLGRPSPYHRGPFGYEPEVASSCALKAFQGDWEVGATARLVIGAPQQSRLQIPVSADSSTHGGRGLEQIPYGSHSSVSTEQTDALRLTWNTIRAPTRSR